MTFQLKPLKFFLWYILTATSILVPSQAFSSLKCSEIFRKSQEPTKIKTTVGFLSELTAVQGVC